MGQNFEHPRVALEKGGSIVLHPAAGGDVILAFRPDGEDESIQIRMTPGDWRAFTAARGWLSRVASPVSP